MDLLPWQVGFHMTFSLFLVTVKVDTNFSCRHIVELGTGIQYYRNTGEVALISEPVWSSSYILHSFWYVSDKNNPKSARILCLSRWSVLKTWLLTSEQHISTLLHRCEIATMHENSRGFLLRRCWGSHSHRHLPNKTVFVVISVIITHLFPMCIK